ncbi:MAG: transition metal uptake transporter, Ni2+-Co2+ transporter (NiCoT) family [Rhodospirillales bacterium]|nr:transition metal uptake transporter, Ni2+-Co2+ transporter (NiCoT) family [Rhodospirillales bacterium]
MGTKLLLPIGGIILIANLAAWLWAGFGLGAAPEAMAAAVLAYTLGLKHAVDADHIAAIDNTTRKLMGEGRRSLAGGLWFSLGHSTIVVLVTLAIALASDGARDWLDGLKDAGALLGTAVSVLFLIVIGLGNLFVLVRLWRQWRRGVVGAHPMPAGVMGRLLRPVLGLVSRSWHLYPVGVLFGLGFDTATEIGLLGLSVAAAVHGLPLYAVLAYPLLFTAAMMTVDALDGIMMVGVYGWALKEPSRKLGYNLFVTLLSVGVAFGIGLIEAAGLIGDEMRLDGGIWAAIGTLNDRFGSLGLAVVASFMLAWLAAYMIDRCRQPTGA